MGTNFYLHEKDSPLKDIADMVRGESVSELLKMELPVHIGKSSGGWCFALHVYPEHNINTLDDWKKLFDRKDVSIINEYHDHVNGNDMIDIITNRKWGIMRDDPPVGYKSQEDFLRLNHAVKGPNNLCRSIIDGIHCVGHGEGTWDYHVGEFS